MKRILTGIILLTFVTLTAGAQSKHHEVKVGNFTRIALIDDINVNYCCDEDSAGLAVFNCSQEVADQLMFSTNSLGRLSIQIENEHLIKGALPTITIYSSSLQEAENAGDSTLRLSGLPMMKEFKVRNVDNGKVIARNLKASKLELEILSGKGKIIAGGACDELSLKLIGAGEIQADAVKAGKVSCRIIGTGSIGCYVNGGELKVSGTGTGKVYYKGTPSKVTVRKLGSIKAIPME